MTRTATDEAPWRAFPETEAYWQAAREGRLLLKRCQDCGEPHHYPRALCPFCGSERTEWIAARGLGTVYSASVTRRGPGAPYTIAYVTLDEGVTMLTHLVDCEPGSVRIGERVEVDFRPDEKGQVLPVFRPHAGAST